MTQTRSNPRIARRGVAAALAALLGAGVFGLSAPAAAADGRYYRMPDGSVQYVRDRDLPDWRRWQDRRWRDDDRPRRWRNDGYSYGQGRNSGELGDGRRRYNAPRNSGELGDGRRDWRFDDRDWQRSAPRNGCGYQYPADGG